MRALILTLLFAIPLLLAAQPAYALKSAGQECVNGSECSSGNCRVIAADCGKKIVNNSVTLAATGKRLENCQPMRAMCATSRSSDCAAHIVDGVIRYDCENNQSPQ